MSGYTKLFPAILDSTVWELPSDVRIVWVTLLAMADRDGIVEASVPGLAKRAAVERRYVEEALACFMAPDPDSRTRDHDGRRLIEIDGGWRILNHGKYRDKASAEEAREKNAARQAAFKARHTKIAEGNARYQALPTVTGNAQVTLGNAQVTPSNTNNKSNDIAEASPPPSPSPNLVVCSDVGESDPTRFRAAHQGLIAGYVRRYKAASGQDWTAWQANDRTIRNVAAWCALGSDDVGERVDRLLSAAFADEWMRSNRWPWAKIAKDPAAYGGNAPIAEPVETIEQIRERQAAHNARLYAHVRKAAT